MTVVRIKRPIRCKDQTDFEFVLDNHQVSPCSITLIVKLYDLIKPRHLSMCEKFTLMLTTQVLDHRCTWLTTMAVMAGPPPL